MIRVHIIHSEPIFVWGLTTALTARGLGITADKESVDPNIRWRADVFLVECRRPRLADLLAEIREASRIAPVLLIGSSECNAPESTYIDAGVSGLIDRGVSVDELVDAIQRTVSDKQSISPVTISSGTPARGRHQAKSLSARERQVLQQIARGLTHSQIASRLRISQHTVDTYVKRIRFKLNVGNKAELARVAVLSQQTDQ